MSDENPLKTVKEAASILGEIIKAAGDNPNVKAAATNLGQTALTLTKTINNALLPLAAINFAFERERLFLREIPTRTSRASDTDTGRNDC